MILEKYHSTPYSKHSIVTKMFLDIKPQYFWKGMKKEIIDFVVGCLEF